MAKSEWTCEGGLKLEFDNRFIPGVDADGIPTRYHEETHDGAL